MGSVSSGHGSRTVVFRKQTEPNPIMHPDLELQLENQKQNQNIRFSEFRRFLFLVC